MPTTAPIPAMDEIQGQTPGGHRGARHQGEAQGEENDARAIVEQAFAFHQNRQAPRSAQGPEHAQ